jgi:K+-sensing histidine kinase KdpD
MNQQAFVRPWWLLPIGRLHPLSWVGITGLLLWVDYLTGPKTQFPVVYVIPVTLAAWYSGRWPALVMAVAMPLVHVVFLIAMWNQPGSIATLVATTTVRGAVIIAMALWFARLSEHERELHRHVHKLEGLLPICSFCKSIRSDSGEWKRLEAFISERSEAQFSHSFCPTCWKTHYSELGDAPDASPKVRPPS